MTSKSPIAARLIKLKDAAAYLGVSPWKLRRLVADGKIAYIPGEANAPWLFDRVDLDAYVDAQKIRL